jgi:hypothetical protein
MGNHIHPETHFLPFVYELRIGGKPFPRERLHSCPYAGGMPAGLLASYRLVCQREPFVHKVVPDEAERPLWEQVRRSIEVAGVLRTQRERCR